MLGAETHKNENGKFIRNKRKRNPKLDIEEKSIDFLIFIFFAWFLAFSFLDDYEGKIDLIEVSFLFDSLSGKVVGNQVGFFSLMFADFLKNC